MDRAEQLKIFARCLGDPIYSIETFLKTFDLTQEGMVPFKLFYKQKDKQTNKPKRHARKQANNTNA